MKTNTKPASIVIVCTALVCITTVFGCRSKPAIPVIAYLPDRIIRDYSDMKEDETVARAWVRRGFELSSCRSITVEPVIDAAQNKNPEAVHVIEQGLQELFADRSGTNGTISVSVRTALLEVKTEPGRIRSWFSDIDDFAYIELELQIQDTQTGLPLLKLVHFSRDKKALSRAMNSILEDLRIFFIRAV